MLTDTFSVECHIKKCKGNKKFGFIYAIINIDGEPAEISTKNKVEVKNWNYEKKKVNGQNIEAKSINENLELIKSQIRQKYRDLQHEPNVITAASVKAAYLSKQKSLKGKKMSELLSEYKEYWGPKLEYGHFKNVRTTTKYVQRFIDEKFPGMYLSQINTEIMAKFEMYVRENPLKAHDPCKGNGLGKHLERFKRIIEWAVEMKWIEINPVTKYSCGVKKKKPPKLKIHFVVAIDKQPFVDPTLQLVKDLFLYSCYTGLAYIDAMKLSKGDFEETNDGRIACTIYRTKTGEMCAVPLLKRAKNILKKYWNRKRTDEGNKIFPFLTNQQVNRSLKIIQEVCGVTLKLTFHVARHTFATSIAIKNGIPLETVQMMMGHRKIATTLLYVEVDEEKVEEDTIDLDMRLEQRIAKQGIATSKLRELDFKKPSADQHT